MGRTESWRWSLFEHGYQKVFIQNRWAYEALGLRGAWWGRRTDSRLRLSSLCRGITVTVSISQRKATSAGVRPAGSGSAMVDWRNFGRFVEV